MDISAIAEGLNKRLRDSSLADFQKKRARRLGARAPYTKKFFSAATAKVGSGYAFHSGGRTELQFNIGFENSPSDTLRYGLAITLQPGQSLTDPIRTMEWRRQKFNEYVVQHPKIVSGLSMWYWRNSKKSPEIDAGPIPEDWMRLGAFIFIGKNAGLAGTALTPSEANYRDIVRLFEQLAPIYEYVESFNKESNANSISYRAARIVWNDFGWTGPSGADGKLKLKKNFERKRGFGHEEWLFDHSRLINGWHYGFMQAFGHGYETYKGKTFNVLVYTKHGRTKKRYWAGRIRNITCIDEQEAMRVHRIYIKNGWIDQMAEELKLVNADAGQMWRERPHTTFNCRYRPADLEKFDPLVAFQKNNQIIKAFYYDTFTYISIRDFLDTRLADEPQAASAEKLDLNKYGETGVSKKGVVKRLQERVEVWSHLRQNEWQVKLLKNLLDTYGKGSAGMEVPVGRGYGDLFIRVGKQEIVVELKTADTASKVVREALGQVVEYGFWPGLVRNRILVISGTPFLDKETGEYLKFLRKHFNLPIWYLRYNNETGTLENLPQLLDHHIREEAL